MPPPPGEDERFDGADGEGALYAAFALTALVQPRFGELVREWRDDLGMTIREAALEARVAPATWCDIEAGRDTLLSTATRIMGWAVKNNLA